MVKADSPWWQWRLAEDRFNSLKKHHQADISVHGHDMFSEVSLMMVTCNRNT